jgi:hypothetical protein
MPPRRRKGLHTFLVGVAAGTAFLAPRAIRAFTPVYDGLWRGPLGNEENQDSAR